MNAGQGGDESSIGTRDSPAQSSAQSDWALPEHDTFESSGSGSQLKSSARRSTQIVGPRRELVSKCFHSSGLRGFGDRRRASREFALLRLLHAEGLPVPAPRQLVRSDGHWTVVMDRIPHAQSLSKLLGGDPSKRLEPDSSSCTFDRTDLAQQIGRLVANLIRAGVEHRDLHLSNLLVDRTGKLWLVDFQRARTVRRRATSELFIDLVTLCGCLREVTARSERRVALIAFARALGREGEFSSLTDPAFVDRLEREAPQVRRASVLRNSKRWMRASGVAERIQVDGKPCIAARGLTPEQRERSFVPHGQSPTLIEADRLTIRPGGRKRTIEAWLVAARLEEHRIPTALPLRLQLGADPTAEFWIPTGCSSLEATGQKLSVLWLARNLGTLLGSLHDRGLHPTALAARDLLVTPSRGWLLRPGIRLERKAPEAGRADSIRTELACEFPDLLNDDAGIAFVTSYREALGTGLGGQQPANANSAPPERSS